MKISKFQKAVILGILLVGLVAWIDIQGFNLLGDKYTQGDFPSSVWPHHLITSLIIFLIPALCYWIFYRKDKSETLAIFLTGYIMFYFLLADVLYFWLQGKQVAQSLPWLAHHPVASFVSSNILHTQGITPMTLYISVVLGLGLVYLITKYLEKIN
jgi:hypothetical protein